jgi:MFS family permease
VPEVQPRWLRVASRREAALHVGAALLGPVVGATLIGAIVPGLVWRAAALSAALTLVIVALLRTVALGRAEWQHIPPRRTEYQRVIGRFAIAFVLVIAASS